VESDLVARLRKFADVKSFPEGGKFLAFQDLLEAADEIERLRRNTGCARNQRSTQFCAEALDAQRDAEKLRKELSEAHYDYRRLMTQMLRERDEARLLYCFRCSEDEAVARDMAKAMGWTCFHDNAARRSTAPTPANTGGGADHQIPEAL